jgi:DNA-3-methyladenine glycosylase
LGADFYDRSVHEVARDLIGCTLLYEGCGGVIVETESYEADDPACHAYVGLTERNEVLFGPPGRAYVYRSYGIHWCMNFVCGDGPGSAVLLRAIEPTAGLEVMRARRGTDDPRLLCSGPGRLCEALGVTSSHNGLRLDEPPFDLIPGEAAGLVTGPRIGISKAIDVPWRFGERGSRFLSKPFR